MIRKDLKENEQFVHCVKIYTDVVLLGTNKLFMIKENNKIFISNVIEKASIYQIEKFDDIFYIIM